MDGNTGIFNIWDGNTGETQLRKHKIKWMETQASSIYGMETQLKHNEESTKFNGWKHMHL